MHLEYARFNPCFYRKQKQINKSFMSHQLILYILPSILYAIIVFIINFLNRQQTITLIDLAFHHGGLNCWSSLNMISAHRHVISGLSDAVSLWQKENNTSMQTWLHRPAPSLSFLPLLSFSQLFKLLRHVALALHHCKSVIDQNQSDSKLQN